MSDTALIIEVPESEFLVGTLRSEFDETASLGVPAHITVLYPFMPMSLVSESVVCGFRGLALEVEAFTFQLTQWRQFETALWLQPIPEVPFKELTLKISTRFPDYPPYGGKHANVQPHLTAASFDKSDYADPKWERIAESTKARLPIDCVASGLSLYANDTDGVWEKCFTLPFSDAI